MKSADHHGINVYGCGVFKDELLALKELYWPDLNILFLNSMLHIRPEKLGKTLFKLMKKEGRQKRNTLLIYGDCCAEMASLTMPPWVVRVRGNNCCDLLLGRQEYRRLSHEGAFFLFPEWARRWQSIFSVELGLDEDNAAGIMGEMHTKLVYLDTGVQPVPTSDLKDCSAYCHLPWEVMKVSLEPLRKAIQDALDRFN